MQGMSDETKIQLLRDAINADVESRKKIIKLRRVIVIMSVVIFALLVKCFI